MRHLPSPVNEVDFWKVPLRGGGLPPRVGRTHQESPPAAIGAPASKHHREEELDTLEIIGSRGPQLRPGTERTSDQLLSGTFSILATMACLNMRHAPQLLLGARGPYTHRWQP